jgi:L,D-transpeptidase catalytic domain
MRRWALAGAAAALLAACPATASAAAPRITLHVKAAMAAKRGQLSLPGQQFTASGTVTPFVAGDRVVVTLYHRSHKVAQRTVRLRSARYSVTLRAPKPGRYAVQAMKVLSATVPRLDARGVSLFVVRPRVHRGQSGALVRYLQRRLAALHHVVPRSGVYDDGTALAVLTWRSTVRLARTTIADAAVFNGLLAGRGQFHVRHPRDGHHVEARLDLQVVALIDHGQVQRLYHTSSGKATTPTVRGRFRVYSKTPGTNSEGMVDSSYFFRGYAIHGYASVPNFPASHGCLRVPIRYARAIFDWVRLGDVVWVES